MSACEFESDGVRNGAKSPKNAAKPVFPERPRIGRETHRGSRSKDDESVAELHALFAGPVGVDKPDKLSTRNHLGVTVEREVFVCPICGAPDRRVPSDAVRTVCEYCGAQVAVPRDQMGLERRCKNHPAVLSVGKCAVCGRGFCEQCLLAYGYGFALQLRPVCPSCAQEYVAGERNKMIVYSVGSLLFAAFTLLIALQGWYLGFAISGTLLIVLCLALYTYDGLSKMPTTQTAEEWWQRYRKRSSR